MLKFKETSCFCLFLNEAVVVLNEAVVEVVCFHVVVSHTVCTMAVLSNSWANRQ